MPTKETFDEVTGNDKTLRAVLSKLLKPHRLPTMAEMEAWTMFQYVEVEQWAAVCLLLVAYGIDGEFPEVPDILIWELQRDAYPAGMSLNDCRKAFASAQIRRYQFTQSVIMHLTGADSIPGRKGGAHETA